MPSFLTNMSGGKAIGGGALAPRSRRGNTNQVNSYWRGGAVNPNASGGFQAVASTGLGYNYLEFRSTGSLTVLEGGTFEFLSFGGGGGGRNGNGYNSFGQGGQKGGTGNLTIASLATGVYTVTIGGGGSGATSNTYYNETPGAMSYFHTFTTGGNQGSGGALNPGGTSANGEAGTQVNTFIGGASLFKAAGGGNSISGIGGSSIGGNGSNGSPGSSTSASGNTASGGGGSGGSGQPNLIGGNGGNGGSGIVYVRWLA